MDDDVTAVALVQEIGKDLRVEKMRGFPDTTVASINTDGEPLATSKQIGFLRRLGVEVPAGLSKVEASRLIDEAQQKVVAV